MLLFRILYAQTKTGGWKPRSSPFGDLGIQLVRPLKFWPNSNNCPSISWLLVYYAGDSVMSRARFSNLWNPLLMTHIGDGCTATASLSPVFNTDGKSVKLLCRCWCQVWYQEPDDISSVLLLPHRNAVSPGREDESWAHTPQSHIFTRERGPFFWLIFIIQMFRNWHSWICKLKSLSYGYMNAFDHL